jgi:hypothetical protein
MQGRRAIKRVSNQGAMMMPAMGGRSRSTWRAGTPNDEQERHAPSITSTGRRNLSSASFLILRLRRTTSPTERASQASSRVAGGSGCQLLVAGVGCAGDGLGSDGAESRREEGRT